MMHTPAHKNLRHPAGQTLADDNARTAALDAEAAKPKVDARIDYHGSIAVLYPLTEAAQLWCDDNIDPDHQQWGSGGIVIEPRYVTDIRQGMARDGLKFD